MIPCWLIACHSNDLNHQPLGIRVLNKALVLFRDSSGKPASFLDACPHRSAPLSKGIIKDGKIVCPYHGWAFNEKGLCTAIPHLDSSSSVPAFRATTFACVEQQGYVWIYAEANEEPTTSPFFFARTPSFKTLRFYQDLPASLRNVIENQLDVTHTSILHRGLFRKSATALKVISVQKSVGESSITMNYIGESAPSGLISRLFGIQKDTQVIHQDALLQPWITEVLYQTPPFEIRIQSTLTPIDDSRTKVFTEVQYHLPKLIGFLKPLITLFVKVILRHDRILLESQSQLLEDSQTPMGVKGPLDFLQPELDFLFKGKPLSPGSQTFNMES